MTVEGITEAHVARAVLSRLIESHDAAAAALIRVLGPVRFLKVIQGEEKISSTQEENAAALMAEETSLRWRSRLPTPSGQQELAAIHQLGGGLLIPETPGWPDALGGPRSRRAVGALVSGERSVGALFPGHRWLSGDGGFSG